MNTYNFKILNAEFDQLVGKLKTEDASYATLSRGIQIVYWILIPFFIFMTIRHYNDSGDFKQIIGGACMVLSFLIFALFFGKYYKEYKYVDYSLPTLLMLKKAAYRYKPFQGRTIWIIVALALMDFGLFYNNQEEGLVLETQVMFIGAILFGLIVGLILWYFKYKPLRDDALRLIAEIEGN